MKKTGGVLAGIAAIAVIIVVVVLAIKGDTGTGWVPKKEESNAVDETQEASGALPAIPNGDGIISSDGTIVETTVREQEGSVDFGEIYCNTSTFTAANATIEVVIGQGSDRSDAILLKPFVSGATDVSFSYFPHRGAICESSNPDLATGSYNYGVTLPEGTETVWISDGSWGSEVLTVGLQVIDNPSKHLIGLFSITIKRDNGMYYIAEFNNTELQNDISDKIAGAVLSDIKSYCTGISVDTLEIDSVFVEVLDSNLYSDSCASIFGGADIYSQNIVSYPVYAATVNTRNSAFGRLTFYYCTAPVPEGQNIPIIDRIMPMRYDVPDVS